MKTFVLNIKIQIPQATLGRIVRPVNLFLLFSPSEKDEQAETVRPPTLRDSSNCPHILGGWIRKPIPELAFKGVVLCLPMAENNLKSNSDWGNSEWWNYLPIAPVWFLVKLTTLPVYLQKLISMHDASRLPNIDCPMHSNGWDEFTSGPLKSPKILWSLAKFGYNTIWFEEIPSVLCMHYLSLDCVLLKLNLNC